MSRNACSSSSLKDDDEGKAGLRSASKANWYWCRVELNQEGSESRISSDKAGVELE